MKRLGVLAVIALLFASAVPAMALTISQTVVFNPTELATPQTLTFNQFDDNGGAYTLLKVTLDLSATISGHMTAENLDQAGGQISVTLDGTATATLYDLTAVANTSASAGPTAIGGFDGLIDGAGADFLDFGALSDSGNGSDVIPPGDLTPFIGTGTIDADVTASATWGFTGVTDAFLHVSNLSKSGEGTLTYEYTNVPEPGTIAMMIMGGLGVVGGVIRKIRK
jgi:hypothetical protein